MPISTRRVAALACCGLLGATAVTAAPAMAARGPGKSPEVRAAKLKQKAFKRWAHAHGLRGQAAKPLADPDRDGNCNWVEFGMRTDPTQAPAAGAPAPTSPGSVVKVKGHVTNVTETGGVISSVTVRTRLRGVPGAEVTVNVGPSSLLILDWSLVQNTSPANDGITVGDEVKAYATRSGEAYDALLALFEDDDHVVAPVVGAPPVTPPAPGVVCRPDDSKPNGMECEAADDDEDGDRHGRGSGR